MKDLRSLEELHAYTAAHSLVVIDFHASWCGPCKFVAPRYHTLAQKLPDVAFCKVDVDQAQDIASFAGIRAMPTFQVYRNGRQVFEMTGVDMDKLEHHICTQQAEEASLTAQPPLAPVVPQRAMMRFESAKPTVVLGKLLEFARELRQEEHPKGPSVDEIARLQSIVEAVDGGAASLCSEGTLQLLCSFVHWPHSRLFPVLDALRLALVEPRNAAFLLSQPEAADSALAAVRANGLTLEAGEVNHMMALRLFCNLLASAPSNAVNETSLELLLPVLEAAAASEAYTASRRGTRIALSTMLLNASVLLAARKSNCERKTPFVCALQPFLTTPQPEIEVRFRVVLALGTLLHEDEDTAALCVALDLNDALMQMKSAHRHKDKLQSCLAEVMEILHRANHN